MEVPAKPPAILSPLDEQLNALTLAAHRRLRDLSQQIRTHSKMPRAMRDEDHLKRLKKERLDADQLYSRCANARTLPSIAAKQAQLAILSALYREQ